jgi:glycosyltransferase involved in cell wall biosynthesis
MKIAYLNSEYPSLSHTFIEREVRELRRLGLDIVTFSVRKPNAMGKLGHGHAKAAQETIVLQDNFFHIIRDVVLGILGAPISGMRSVIASQKLSPPGIGNRIKHLAYWAQALRLARRLRREGINHIHVHMANSGAAIALLACEYNRSLTYSLTIHGSAEFFHVDSWTLQPKTESAKYVRCISHFCRAQVMAWADPDRWENFHVVRCGVDTNAYSPRSDARNGRFRILTVGRLHPIKGYDVLLEACYLLKKDGIDFQLEMVGDGPMRSRLESQTKQLGLTDCVRFAGAVGQDEIGLYYDLADIMVISSFMEGVPVVLMEAMAKQLGVVASVVGGVPELVDDGRHGFLVPPGCPSALADAIKRYVANRQLCRIHGCLGRERVLNEYNICGSARGMYDLFGLYKII